MAEPTVFKFSYKELAALMVKQQGIREGFWGVYVRFGIAAANMGPDPESIVPAAIVPLTEIGLQRLDEAHPLAINAADVWNQPTPQATK